MDSLIYFYNVLVYKIVTRYGGMAGQRWPHGY